MAFSLKTWVNRISEYPNRRKLTHEDGSMELVTVARAEGQISAEGNAFSAEEMNDLENRIKDGFDEVNQSLTELIIQSVIINQNGLYGYIKDCIGSVIYKNKTAFFHIEGEFSGTIDLLFSAFGLNPNLKTPVAIYGATGVLKLLGFSESQKGNKLYVKVGSNTNAIQISTSATDFYGITFAIDFA